MIQSVGRESGVGLVEILVAMLLGLLLTMGMVQIFIGSKQAYRAQDALSRIQETGRYAMEVLTSNIRMAGFQGCGSLDEVTPNVVANSMPGLASFNAQSAVRGYEYQANGTFSPLYGDTSGTGDDPASVLPGTDVITVSRVSECSTYLAGGMTSESADIAINSANSCGFQAGDLVLITDCDSSDLFRVSAVSAPVGTTIQLSHDNVQNSTNRLGKVYGQDARIYKFLQLDYFVRNNAFGQPALYTRTNGGAAQELADGVTDLQITYGEDTTNNFFVDQYVTPQLVTDWGRVNSVRAVLTLSSRAGNLSIDNQRGFTQTMTSTIGLRNRLP